MLECFLAGSEDSLCQFHTVVKLSLLCSHSSPLIIKKPSSLNQFQIKRTYTHVLMPIYNGTKLLLVNCFPNMMIGFMAHDFLERNFLFVHLWHSCQYQTFSCKLVMTLEFACYCLFIHDQHIHRLSVDIICKMT